VLQWPPRFQVARLGVEAVVSSTQVLLSVVAEAEAVAAVLLVAASPHPPTPAVAVVADRCGNQLVAVDFLARRFYPRK
jgi:hypothetical protein